MAVYVSVVWVNITPVESVTDEINGQVEICALVSTSTSTERSFVVSLSTNDGTATGVCMLILLFSCH